MKNFLLTLFTAGLTIHCLNAQTNVPALINTSQVWTAAGNPYIVNQNTYIDTGVYVLLMPGVEVITPNKDIQLMISGSFQAKGKKDSLVKITDLTLQFNINSKDYNAVNGSGAYFNYCHFVNTANGSKYGSITYTCTDLKVENSIFTTYHNGISANDPSPISRDSSNLEVRDCNFSEIGNMNAYSNPIWTSGRTLQLYIVDCSFSNGGNLNVYGNHIYFEKNRTEKVRPRFYLYKQARIECNVFKQVTYSLEIRMVSNTGSNRLDFIYNTLDSVGNYMNAPMVELVRGFSTAGEIIHFNANNFLRNTSNTAKVLIAAVNKAPFATDLLDFTSNYWGSSDSNTIKTYIIDYNDDIKIYGKINFSKYEKSPVYSCSYSSGCAVADFGFSVNDSTVVFSDSSNGLTAYKVKWNFGDGSGSDQKNVSHTYLNAGTYLVCLTVTDTFGNVCDSICKTIVITDQKFCFASYYFAVDTLLPNTVFAINDSKGIHAQTDYLWTFGDGTNSSLMQPVHQYSQQGKYQLCLNISDALSVCNSTYCDTLDLNTQGITLRVLNENKLELSPNPVHKYAFNVYPNPGNGVFTILANNPLFHSINICVMNSYGVSIYKMDDLIMDDQEKIKIDLSDYPAGIYFVQISSETANETLKIMVQK